MSTAAPERLRACVAAVFGLLLVTTSVLATAPTSHATGTTGRLAVPDRMATAAAVADRAFPGHADSVYLARADDFPDALAAAGLTDGPTLLVPRDGVVPDVVRAAVARLTPRTVVALGGPGSVSDAVLASAAAGRATGRIAGVDRFGTAVALSRRAFPVGAPTVYLARADTFPDALSAGSLSDGPLLLVPRDGPVPDVVTAEIGRLAPRRVVALGNASAVSENVLATAASGRATDRLAGDDRFGTSTAIARAAFPDGTPVVYLARADTFPDALAAGALADGPVLLVPYDATSLPAPIAAAITGLRASRIVALGDENAVTTATTWAAEQIAPGGNEYLGIAGQGGAGGEVSFSWQYPSVVDGTLYDRSAVASWGAPNSGYDVPLPAGTARFRTTVQTPGEHPQPYYSTSMDVVVDGKVVATTALGVGSHRDLDVDLTGASDLRLEFHGPSAPYLDPYDPPGFRTVLGNARLSSATAVDDGSLYVHPPVARAQQFLDELEPSWGTVGWLNSGPVALAGSQYAHGLSTVPVTAWNNPPTLDTKTYPLNRVYRRFTALAGMSDDSPGNDATAQLQVFADGRLVGTATLVKGRATRLDVDVAGSLDLELRVTNTYPTRGQAVLADAQVTP